MGKGTENGAAVQGPDKTKDPVTEGTKGSSQKDNPKNVNGGGSLTFKQALKEVGDIFEGEVSFGLQAKLKAGVGSVGIDFGTERSAIEGSQVKKTTTQGLELSVGVKNLLGGSVGGKAERSGHPQMQEYNPFTGQRVRGESISEYMRGYEAQPTGGWSIGPIGQKDGGDVKVEVGAALIFGVEVRVNLTEAYDFIQKVDQ